MRPRVDPQPQPLIAVDDLGRHAGRHLADPRQVAGCRRVDGAVGGGGRRQRPEPPQSLRAPPPIARADATRPYPLPDSTHRPPSPAVARGAGCGVAVRGAGGALCWRRPRRSPTGIRPATCSPPRRCTCPATGGSRVRRRRRLSGAAGRGPARRRPDPRGADRHARPTSARSPSCGASRRTTRRFLGQELSQVYRGTLVVAMPDGLRRRTWATSRRREVGVVNPLRASSIDDGHRSWCRQWPRRTGIASPRPRPRLQPGSASALGSVDLGSWLALAAGAALIAAAWTASLRARPLRARLRRAPRERVGSAAMDPERARDLLARERDRIEQALGLHTGGSLESDENVEPGDEGSEDLYQDELDAGRARRPAGGAGRRRARRGAARGRDLRAVGAQRGADPRRPARGPPDGRADRRRAAAPVAGSSCTATQVSRGRRGGQRASTAARGTPLDPHRLQAHVVGAGVQVRLGGGDDLLGGPVRARSCRSGGPSRRRRCRPR